LPVRLSVIVIVFSGMRGHLCASDAHRTESNLAEPMAVFKPNL
jgi:hypothetical protein